MRELNNLIVHGEAPEIDQLFKRMEASDEARGWKRSSEVEQAVRASGRGRLGVFCYLWEGGPGLPPASLLIHRRGPGEMASSSIVPAERRSLTDEESNNILARFEANVLRPLSEGLDVETTIAPPHGSRLEWSLSPAAFSKLNWFVTMTSNPSDLSSEDRARWDDFWVQTYSDGSIVEVRALGIWLKEHGFSESQAAALIARSEAGTMMAHHGGF